MLTQATSSDNGCQRYQEQQQHHTPQSGAILLLSLLWTRTSRTSRKTGIKNLGTSPTSACRECNCTVSRVASICFRIAPYRTPGGFRNDAECGTRNSAKQMSAIPDSRHSRFSEQSDIRKFRIPEHRSSVSPELWNSENPHFRNSRFPEFRNCGFPEIRISRNPDLHAEHRMQGYPGPEMRNANAEFRNDWVPPSTHPDFIENVPECHSQHCR